MSIPAPYEAGKWSLWALTVSSAGLRFSAPIQVRVFRPLQVEFHLPPSLRVRETLEVDIKIGNNINSCMDVSNYITHILFLLKTVSSYNLIVFQIYYATKWPSKILFYFNLWNVSITTAYFVLFCNSGNSFLFISGHYHFN